MNIIQIASDLDINTPNDDVVRALTIIINRFCYDFSAEQRFNLVNSIIENQPL